MGRLNQERNEVLVPVLKQHLSLTIFGRTHNNSKEPNMSYIDGFVCAVPSGNKDAFIQHAKHIDHVFKELGALRVVEGWGDNVPRGQSTDFYKAVNAKHNETVCISWVEWPDKQTRDRGNEKIQEMAKTDERFDQDKYPVPFDGVRMILGSFDIVYEI